jgi:hypothetical protein
MWWAIAQAVVVEISLLASSTTQSLARLVVVYHHDPQSAAGSTHPAGVIHPRRHPFIHHQEIIMFFAGCG